MRSRARGVNCKQKHRISVPKADGYGYAYITTIDDKPIWTLMKEYINGLDKDQIFTRKELLFSIYTDLGIYIGQYPTTADQYKRYLIKADALESVSNGVYRKLRNIPDQLSIHKLKNHVYGNDWKSWFITIDEI